MVCQLQAEYTVNPANGTINNSTGWYEEGASVPLRATPNAGYHFLQWTGDVSNIQDINSADTTILINDAATISAEFALNIVEIVTSHSELGVNEGTSSNNLTVSLSNQPVSDVNLSISKILGDSDIAADENQMFQFTPTNWNAPQQIVISVQNDNDAIAGRAEFQIGGLGLAGINFIVQEIDADYPPSLHFTASHISVSENDGILSIPVALTAE